MELSEGSGHDERSLLFRYSCRQKPPEFRIGYSKRSYFCVARVRVFVAGPMTALSDDRAVGTIGDDFGNPFVREGGAKYPY